MSIKKIVRRHECNPIITADAVPGADAVYNCGATKFKDKYILLVSVSKPGSGGCGRAVHVAESDDGVHFKVRPEPFISSDDKGPYTEYNYDLCDPRITLLEGTYYITYPAHQPGLGIIGILGKTDDFKKFERLGVISLPSNRVPVLFPEKIDGYYVRLDRPFGVYNGSLWLSYSKDLFYWGNFKHLMSAGIQAWNNFKVGPSGPPIKTDAGWLLLYHSVSGPNISAPAYYQSCALLDLKDPSKIIGRPNEYFLGPEMLYERVGRVPNVVFSCGHILEPDGMIKFYYAGADTCICLAEIPVDRLVESCQGCPK